MNRRARKQRWPHRAGCCVDAPARSPRLLALLCLAALGLAGCASVNLHHDPGRAHHRPDGFVNLHPGHDRADGGFWSWQWQRWTRGLAPQDPERIPRARPQVEYLQANRKDITVTWIGHATTLWQIGGLNILTDPHFSERASPVGFAGPRRATPPALSLADLPRIDLVLISHNHYDHLDRATVHALHRQAGGPPLFLVPLGIDHWMQDEGIAPVRALDWWDSHRVNEVDLTLVPAHHWSSRTPWDRNRSLWGGFVAAHDGFSMYHSGDTGYSPVFRTIGERFGGFDFAQLPVGCYEPRWFMKGHHVNEAEAVQIHRDVRSRLSLGVHWGAFRLCDEPVDAPLDGLPRALETMNESPSALVLFGLGETRVLRQGR
ncbi:MAG: MBL fold metallo-hydrolase [Burkholderiales bacterium]|nr:MAG: MBL fold metallo-hydrolase [Burkholderiales bacterium]